MANVCGCIDDFVGVGSVCAWKTTACGRSVSLNTESQLDVPGVGQASVTVTKILGTVMA